MNTRLLAFIAAHPDLWSALIVVLALGFGGIVGWTQIFLGFIFWATLTGIIMIFSHKNIGK